jgi:hypothetical protein
MKKYLTAWDVFEMIQSDMKLWEFVETEEPEPGKLIKTVYLPFGIGKTVVNLEGLTDGIKRGAAVAQYGAHIRAVIKNRTDDEAITMRVKQASAKPRPSDSTSSVVGDAGGVQEQEAEEENLQGTAPAHEEHDAGVIQFGEALVAQRAALHDRITRAEDDLARWKREWNALDAACAAMEE